MESIDPLDKANEDRLKPQDENPEVDLESILERNEELIEEIEELEGNIEEATEEIFAESSSGGKDKKITREMEGLLMRLQYESVRFTRLLTSEISRRSQNVVNTFRDKHIYKKSERLSERIQNNKIFSVYDKAQRKFDSKSNEKPTEEGEEKIEEAKQKEIRAFRALLKQATPFLETIAGGDWAHSNHKRNAYGITIGLLRTLADKSTELGLDDELFKIITVTEGMMKIQISNNTSSYSVGSIIEKGRIYFEKKIQDLPQEERTDAQVKEVFKNNPFLICDYLQSGGSGRRRDNKELLREQANTILENYPTSKLLPYSTTNTFGQCIENYPEEFLLDSQKRGHIFEAYKNNALEHGNCRSLVGAISYFSEELEELTPEEMNQILDNIYAHDITSNEYASFIGSLPLTEEVFKKIFEKLKPVTYEKADDLPFSKENLLGLLHSTDRREKDFSIPLLHHKYFELTTEEKVEYFENVSKSSLAKEPSLQVLIQVFKDESLLKILPIEDINKLIGSSLGGHPEVERFHVISTLFEEYNVGQEYSDVLRDYFISRCDESHLKGFFGTDRVGNSHFSWVLADAELSNELERQFYKKGHPNDLRHFFYEVIDGKRQAVDRAELFRGYVGKLYNFPTEEFINLFLIRKNIELEFAPIFASIVTSKDLIEQIQEQYRLTQISAEQYQWALLTISSHGDLENSRSAFATYLQTREQFKHIPSSEVIDSHVVNLVSELHKKPELFPVNRIIDNISNKKLSEEEIRLYLRTFFEKTYEFENLHSHILNVLCSGNSTFIALAYPELVNQQEYLNRLSESKDPETMASLVRFYLKAEDELPGVPVPTTFRSIAGENYRQHLIKQALELKNIRVYTSFIERFEDMTLEERDLFIESLESSSDIFESVKDNAYIVHFAQHVMFGAEKNGQLFEPYVERMFTKIFTSTRMPSDAFGILAENSRDFFLRFPKIFDAYIHECETRPNVNVFNVLKTFIPNGSKGSLSEIQVENLSRRYLQNHFINEDVFRFYKNKTLTPSEGYPVFYLDQELFDQSIVKLISNYSTTFDSETVLNFLYLQKEYRSPDLITCSPNQEADLVKRLVSQNSIDTSFWEKIYKFDNEIVTTAIKSEFTNKSMSFGNLKALLKTDNNLFPELSESTMKYCLEFCFKKGDFGFSINSSERQSVFEQYLERYKNNQSSIEYTKQEVQKIIDPEEKRLYQLKLLRADLLSGGELKELYESIHEGGDVRAQVIASAEIFGSLASMQAIDSVKSFFSTESKDAEASLERLNSFVNKYSLFNKGRTIAVMLFAKEYLPERTPAEIVDKVAGRLAKYERILDRYQYNQIPKGLHVSLGMEYEITQSTAGGYQELTGRKLKEDIVRLSEAAHIGKGRDAVHEIATQPTVSPYLLILEAQTLNDLEYIDFNFDRSPLYQQGARGYHLTLGGERGLKINANTNFLQNAILTASWGGILAGEPGKNNLRGRGVGLRTRGTNDGNNIQVFDKKTDSVELRALSIDKMEPFQRTLVTTYHGGIAIQALEEYTSLSSDMLPLFLERNATSNAEEFIVDLKQNGCLRKDPEDPKVAEILYSWATLVNEVKKAIVYHTEQFLDGETHGYIDEDGVLVEADEYGGFYNEKRFEAVVSSIDPTLSVEEYVSSTHFAVNDFFSGFSEKVSDSLTKINNLYLKPSTVAVMKNKDESKATMIKRGDQANAIAMLETTKLDNVTLERRDEPAYLEETIFGTLGERREGYYTIQGASERMITHAVQKALLQFNREMESIVNVSA